jgi:mono/diheme cytochrome c family protein
VDRKRGVDRLRTLAALPAMMMALVTGCQENASEGAELVEGVEEVEDSIASLSPVALQALPAGFDADEVELGRERYVVCSVCHGLDATGTPLGPSLRDTSWIHITGTAPEIAQIIRAGVPEPEQFPVPMPTMGGGEFDQQEFDALVAYVHALSQS